MSRFKGWNEAALRKLNLQIVYQPKEPKLLRKTYKLPKPDYPGMIYNALKILGVDVIREYRFLHDRRFRFDLAIVSSKVAIEFDGGIFNQGRHIRAIGFATDAKKSNLATMHGWKLLRYTTLDLNNPLWDFIIAQEIKNLLLKMSEVNDGQTK